MHANKKTVIENTPDMGAFVDIVEGYKSAQNIGALLRLGKQSVKGLGFSRMTYHQLPPIGNYLGSGLQRYFAYNIPEIVRSNYDAMYNKKTDPLIRYVLETGNAIWLSDALKLKHFIDIGHDEVIEKTIKALGDGLAIPLYGPKLNPGYAFVAMNPESGGKSNLNKWIAACSASVFHTRYCMLKNKVAKTINLTVREMEVLELVVMGKTNPEIATILDISKFTVNSYMKNMFLKFGTTDRVSTVVAALTHEVVV